MTHHSKGNAARLAVTAGLAMALCCAPALPAQAAHAATLDDLQAQVDAASKAYDEASQQVDELESKIEESQARIDEVQAKLPEQRERASEATRAMYKMQQDSPGLVSLLLRSTDLSDFLNTYTYIDAVQSDNADQVKQLADMERELTNAQSTLTAAQAEAQTQKANAETALANAQQALDALNQQILAEQAAKEAAEREAAEKAAAEAAQQQAESQAATTDAATTTGSSSSSSDTSGSSNTSQPSTPSNPNATDGSEVETDGEWMLGKASAYSTSTNTGGNATASGEILTDDSMTVAVPTSQRYLLGRSVQIRYNGKTVTARVTDTGGFAAYGRALDLAGGVWKAFGFSSPNAWGVRTVQYRFL